MEKLTKQGKYFIIIIIGSSFLITYLHYSTYPNIPDLHDIFTELYYIPLLLGALVFGLKGAVLTLVFVSAIYAPYVLINWSRTDLFAANKLLHALFSGSLTILAGALVDREKKHRKQAEKDHYLAGLGQAAAAIMHDLKNPLITISGYAKRIQQGKGNIDTASQTIIDSAEDMQMIVYDVLDFAKPIRLVSREEDLASIMEQSCNFCKPKADAKGVNLTVNLPAEPINMEIDKSHFNRVLINLINNAIDASNEGEMIIISATLEKDRLAIKIRDSGEGMDRETLENVFIPFYTTKKSSGTGLGMAIAKKIIEGHQGKINITSQPGSGTEIIIELPCRQKGPS